MESTEGLAAVAARPFGPGAQQMVNATAAAGPEHRADLAGGPARQPDISLFCLPHAGGTAAQFDRWAGWLPGHIAPVGVDLPGRGTRRCEPLVTRWPRLVADLTDTVERQITGGYALAGHSLGALLAYDIARSLNERGRPPSLLLVAGRNGPSAELSHRPMHALPDHQLLDSLARLGGIPAPLAREPDLLRAFLPALRNDLRLAETYARVQGPVLACPIVAFIGRRDRMTDSGAALAWARETAVTFELTIIDAGHFFLDDPAFTAAAAARLARLTPV